LQSNLGFLLYSPQLTKAINLLETIH